MNTMLSVYYYQFFFVFVFFFGYSWVQTLYQRGLFHVRTYCTAMTKYTFGHCRQLRARKVIFSYVYSLKVIFMQYIFFVFFSFLFYFKIIFCIFFFFYTYSNNHHCYVLSTCPSNYKCNRSSFFYFFIFIYIYIFLFFVFCFLRKIHCTPTLTKKLFRTIFTVA